MNKRSVRFVVLLILLTLVASSALVNTGSIPKALAANPTASFFNPSLNCNQEYFNHGALGSAQYNIYVPSGYVLKEHIVDIWGTYWSSQPGQTSYHEYNYQYNGSWSASGTLYYWVDIDGGSLYHSLELYAPSGLLVSSTEVSMGCPGGVSSHGGDIFGPMPPDPDSRVMGTMLADSPVYSEPNPNSPVPDTLLTAGQTWFAVRKLTGTDGNIWYEIFVGGWHNGFVPASVMSIDGTLGEEEVEGPSGGEAAAEVAVPVAPPPDPKSANENGGGVGGGG